VGDLLDRAETEVDGGTPDSPRKLQTRKFERGAAVGRYIMLDRLGGGGMGVVYAAYDPELDRKIAIKLVRASAATEARDRLLREAQAMARLSHPNVIAVYDVGTVDDEVFIAMELVDGPPLSTLVKDQRPAQHELLSIFLQAGRGLAAAHAAGIIHRDFKPDNVLVGKDGRVRVLDFGLARAAGEDDPKAAPVELGKETEISGRQALATPLTQTGAFLGTPAYMAPEQMTGKATDARTDQFSFCIALYEALYGERPFTGDTMLALAHNVISGQVRAVPNDSQVPTPLRSVLLRGLSAKPEERFPSMEALLEALAPRQETVSSASPLWWAALGVALLGVGVLGFSYARKQRQLVCRGAEQQLVGVWDEPRRQAVQAAFLHTGKVFAQDAFAGAARALDEYTRRWVGMRQEACEATRVRGEQSEELLDLRMECLGQRREEVRALVDLFTEADSDVVTKAVQAASGIAELSTCANAAALRAPIRPPADARVQRQVEALRAKLAQVKALREAGKYKPGMELASTIVDEAKHLGYRPVESEALLSLGKLHEDMGKYDAAEGALVEAAALAEVLHHDQVAAEAWLTLVGIARNNAHYGEATRWGRLAEAKIERAGSNPKQQSGLLISMSGVLFDQGRYAEALAGDRRALAIVEKAFGPQSPLVAPALDAVGADLVTLSENEEAIQYYRRALAIEENGLGPKHPHVAYLLNNLGAALREQGNLDEALTYHRRELEIWQNALGLEHPDVASALSSIGLDLGSQGEYAEALDYHRRALAIEEKAFGSQHPVVATALEEIGHQLSREGQYGEALEYHRRALAIQEKALGPEHPNVGITLGNIGFELSGQGKYEEALGYERRALPILEKAFGTESPDLAGALVETGKALLGMGAAQSAVAPLERALILQKRTPKRFADLAEVQFTLARALWDSAQGRERAKTLASEALAGYRAAGLRGKKDLPVVEAWLARHGGVR
jgi:tetratricopeptide (TPR) repeat protein/tRNA A-37 threonylcarbamoyl transferase component Bud32